MKVNGVQHSTLLTFIVWGEGCWDLFQNILFWEQHKGKNDIIFFVDLLHRDLGVDTWDAGKGNAFEKLNFF